uniref:Glycogen [starch] synthase n=1 Tax=Elaeophora elaphi TaxID=1147741 RepID=A0A0R3RP80_9BILA
MANSGHMLRSFSRSKIEMALAGMNLEQSKLVRMDAGETARREGRCVFECSWEVANKV